VFEIKKESLAQKKRLINSDQPLNIIITVISAY